MNLLRRLFYRVFKCYRRITVGCFTYAEGDRLIRESMGKSERERWQLAIPEEDRNSVFGVVWLEQKERITGD